MVGGGDAPKAGIGAGTGAGWVDGLGAPRVGPSVGGEGFTPVAGLGAPGVTPGTFSFRLGFGAGGGGVVMLI